MLRHSLMVVVMGICCSVTHSVTPFFEDKGSTVYCPMSHVVKEETRILKAPVVEVDTKPLSVVSLHTTTLSTSITLTDTTYLARTITVHRPNVQILQTIVVTSPQHITLTEVSTVSWPITLTTTALTTTTSTRFLHTTTTLVPPRPSPLTITSILVLEQPVTTMVSSVSYVTPVETVVEFQTKTVTTSIIVQGPATSSTYTITDTIVFTVCLPESLLI